VIVFGVSEDIKFFSRESSGHTGGLHNIEGAIHLWSVVASKGKREGSSHSQSALEAS
jgi:hypothetical protein